MTELATNRTAISADSKLIKKLANSGTSQSLDEIIDSALRKYLKENQQPRPPKLITADSAEGQRILKRWVDWLHTITNHVACLAGDRKIFNDIMQVCNEHSDLREWWGSFYDWILINYSERAVMTVRRLLDGGKGSVSLHNLIKDIIDYPSLITRDTYVQKWVAATGSSFLAFEQKRAHETFDRFAGPGGQQLDPEILNVKLTETCDKAANLRLFANCSVAHISQKQRNATFGELDSVIDAIGDLLKWVDLLVTRNCPHNLEPTLEVLWDAKWIVSLAEERMAQRRDPRRFRSKCKLAVKTD